MLLFWDRFAVTKPLSQIQRSTLWPLQDADPTPSFGGFGLSWTAPGPLPDGFDGYYIEVGRTDDAPNAWDVADAAMRSMDRPAPYEGQNVEHTYRVATMVVDPDGTRRFSEYVSTTFTFVLPAVPGPG